MEFKRYLRVTPVRCNPSNPFTPARICVSWRSAGSRILLTMGRLHLRISAPLLLALGACGQPQILRMGVAGTKDSSRFQCAPETAEAGIEVPLRRLSKDELANTVVDLAIYTLGRT